MLRSRITPCLLVHKKGLVKTVQFKDPKYVGDPINAVKIFNEKEVDELMVLDIDATVEGRGPDFTMIKNLAIECRMPFCYGGGVTTVDQAKNIIKLGAEKVALSSAAINDTSLLRKMGEAVGSQSVVVVIDVKKKKGLLGKTTYEIYTKNGREKSGKKLENFLKELNDIGVGEIVINSIDRDGTMEGYDNTLVKLVRDAVDIPITILGGAGSHEDIKSLIKDYKIIGAAAGSLFVFKGKYRAVLINYPNRIEKRNILNNQ
ncbi:MAG TPA: AglZ/HisF2 family acetamidino modification protein [Saprospiraceae bacterium]|nr:AglZ/HisF2 family acetamidino modification protein [Saprospiraceae bacterium]HMY83385.1 AglZ/HisF2 family acetamidino modification protein [Saprospiraceae bacterium]HNA75179.1 AglZ/HisF2 family acetamidino modification protein [Saprospiraceae bacterium]HNK08131.1 AglZ/HisF2 family acetamidino modification protein [Saprospiraceae bacterium]HNK22160.1 AglZ/HisF2 family acetamidino modification protein [Saprospiraceae bacterium]